MAPPGLPQPIADKLNAAVVEIMRDPIAITKFSESVKVTPDVLVGSAFKKAVMADYGQWSAEAKRLNIEIDN